MDGFIYINFANMCVKMYVCTKIRFSMSLRVEEFAGENAYMLVRGYVKYGAKTRKKEIFFKKVFLRRATAMWSVCRLRFSRPPVRKQLREAQAAESCSLGSPFLQG